MTTIRTSGSPPDAKINADGHRTYRWPDPVTGRERELLSVTSIRKLVGEPFALVNWQINKVLDRALSEEFMERLAGPASPMGVRFALPLEAMDLAALRKWLRAASTEERDAAGSKGLDIHGALELGLKPEQCNEQTRPYIRQVYNFLDDTGWKIVAQEFQVFNLSVGYAGTADVLFQAPNGRIVLGDWKTSKGVYVDHVVQLHAYLAGEFVGTGGVVDEKLTGWLTPATAAGILHLKPDGWTWHDVEFREDVMRAFIGSVQFAQLLAAHKTPDALFSGRKDGRAK